MTVRQTSKDAFWEIEASGKLGDQQKRLMFFFYGLKGKALCRREIAEQSGMPINVVCGRVKELIDKGWLEDDETAIDPVTEKTVHMVRIKAAQPELQLEAA